MSALSTGPPRSRGTRERHHAEGMAMRVSELIYLKEGERVLRAGLDREEMTIGSDPTSHVMVWDPSVPGRAATLTDLRGGRFLLRDHTPGMILVNGEPLTKDGCYLKNGDRIRIGSFELQLETLVTVP